MSNLHRLETARAIQQSSAHKLESQNRSLEVTVTTLGNFIQQLAESRSDVEIPGDVRRIVAQLGVAEKRQNSIASKLYPLKVIEDNNNKYHPTKSNSAGRESSQRSFKGNNITADPPYPLKSALSQPNLGSKLEKVSSFFANSHNHIRQQRAQMAALRSSPGDERSEICCGNEENDPKTVNIDIQITDTVGDEIENRGGDNLLQIERNAMIEKSISLPLSNAKLKLKSSKSAYELGSVKKVPTSKLEDTSDNSNAAGTIHPLDTCSDVNFKYGGTTKLKCIKPVVRIPGQNGQGDNLGKEIAGQNSEILTR